MSFWTWEVKKCFQVRLRSFLSTKSRKRLEVFGLKISSRSKKNNMHTVFLMFQIISFVWSLSFFESSQKGQLFLIFLIYLYVEYSKKQTVCRLKKLYLSNNWNRVSGSCSSDPKTIDLICSCFFCTF